MASSEAGPSRVNGRPAGDEAATVASELDRLHSSLRRLHQSSSPSTLHRMSSRSVSKQSIPSAVEFRETVAKLRNASRSFEGQALRLASSQEVAGSSAGPASQAATKERLLALRKETSQHTHQLALTRRSLTDLMSSSRRILERRRPLPKKLHVGALEESTTRPASFEWTQDGALELLSSMAASLESLAQEMMLETFSEPQQVEGDFLSEENTATSLHSHTVTQGGRLLVLDFELGLQFSREKSIKRLSPFAHVKLSFAHDGAAQQGSPTKGSMNPENGKLADLLQADVSGLLQLIFGRDDALVDEDSLSVDERRQRRAAAVYGRLHANLAKLAEMDRLSSASNGIGPSADLFAALHGVYKSVKRIEDSTTHAAESRGFAQGLGLPLLHAGKVGPTMVYDAATHLANSQSVLSAALARGLNAAQDADLFCVDICIEKAAETSWGSPSSGDVRSQLPPLNPALTYVACLDPPVLLPRILASRLAAAVGHEVVAKAGAGKIAPAEKSGVDYVTLVERHCQPRSDDLQASYVNLKVSAPSSTPFGQGLRLDSIPFTSLGQLQAIIEVLQKGSSFLRPLQKRFTEVPDEASKQRADSLLIGLGVSPRSSSLPSLRLELTGLRPDDEKLGFRLSGLISPLATAKALPRTLHATVAVTASSSNDAVISASLEDPLRSILDDEGTEADNSSALPSAWATAIANLFSTSDDLHAVAYILIHWALSILSPAPAPAPVAAIPAIVTAAAVKSEPETSPTTAIAIAPATTLAQADEVDEGDDTLMELSPLPPAPTMSKTRSQSPRASSPTTAGGISPPTTTTATGATSRASRAKSPPTPLAVTTRRNSSTSTSQNQNQSQRTRSSPSNHSHSHSHSRSPIPPGPGPGPVSPTSSTSPTTTSASASAPVVTTRRRSQAQAQAQTQAQGQGQGQMKGERSGAGSPSPPPPPPPTQSSGEATGTATTMGGASSRMMTRRGSSQQSHS